MVKSIFASRTFWFNVFSGALILVGTLQGYYGALPYLVAASTIINIVLRLITSQPVNLTGSSQS